MIFNSQQQTQTNTSSNTSTTMINNEDLIEEKETIITPIKVNKNKEKTISLQKEIIDYFEEHKYELITDITKITAKNNSLRYICKCGTEKHKSYKDILLKGCRGCNNEKLKEKPSENNIVYPTDDPDEKWAPIEGGFISSKGRACNLFGKILKADEKGRYYLAGKSQYISILIAKAFKLEGIDKLEGKKSNSIVRIKDKDNITLENVYIGTRNEVGSINGKKARQSEEFQTVLHMDLVEHIKKYKCVSVPELPYHKIFEDGSIFNSERGAGGNRFLTASLSSNKNENKYKTIHTSNGSYKVHRLVCYAFHPIEGLTSFSDYDPKLYQVNHIDGNTLNNHKDNLEWVTQNQNMQHAYDNKLNKKVRPVLQFKLNEDKTKGEFIAEYESLAKAARELNIPEHRIRESAKGKRPQKDFFWCYKFEDENDEWSKKFSSGGK